MSDLSGESGLKQYSDMELRTKEIYTAQHLNYHRDRDLFERFLEASLHEGFYGISHAALKGCEVLDAGSGSTAYFEVAMHRLGASSVTCVDLGTQWMADLMRAAKSYGVPEQFLTLVDGSTLSLPFPDETFDFTASNGVIMHLDSKDSAEVALAELVRVTKPGGGLYVYVGSENPGILERYVTPALRLAYLEDPEFRSFIDSLNLSEVRDQIRTTYEQAQKHDPGLSAVGSIEDLITLDSLTFFQNALQVPNQLSSELSFDWAAGVLARSGCKQVERVPEIYWMRRDFRRYLSPFHYFRTSPLSRIMYGGGMVKIFARKS